MMHGQTQIKSDYLSQTKKEFSASTQLQILQLHGVCYECCNNKPSRCVVLTKINVIQSKKQRYIQ
jgi:hypothetical protein